MHSMAYSIEGLMATMIAELICLIRYKGAPNADSARLDCHAGCLGDGMQIVSSGRRRIIFGCDLA
jgi:hypothetical protein